jgi:hypothetical protein
VNGKGFCAFLADDPFNCFDYPVVISLKKFGADAGGTVDVCVDAVHKCESGRCATACTPNECIPDEGGKKCIQATGRCGCDVDADCNGVQGASKCNATTHVCECVSNADCNNTLNADVCVAGKCGCSSGTVCKDQEFLGTTLTCK